MHPGNYYHREFGWANGIVGEPQPIPAGSSADWTWYTATERPDQRCGMVYFEFQGWVYAAIYDQQGQLVETKASPLMSSGGSPD